MAAILKISRYLREFYFDNIYDIKNCHQNVFSIRR